LYIYIFIKKKKIIYNFIYLIKEFIPDTTEKIQAFQYLFMMLPTSHLVLLEILLQFLSEIIQHFDENHMNAHNLACIFAPNLLRSKESSSSANLLSLSSSEEYEVALQVIEFLLNHKDKFCITSPDVKPFQLCNKIDGISSSNLNNINSLSLTDFPSFKKSSLFFRFSSISGSNKNIATDHNNSNNNNTEKDKSSQLKNEIKAEEEESTDTLPKINQEHSSYTISNIPQNRTSVTFSIDNTKSNKTDTNDDTNTNSNTTNNETEKEADTNANTYHPNFDRNSFSSNPSPALSGLAIKSKSNLENVRKHSDDSFYQLNTCALVSTSLNRLNYPLIKNKNYIEYLTKDNDNITPAKASKYHFFNLYLIL